MKLRSIYTCLLFLVLPMLASSQSDESSIRILVKEMADVVDNLSTNLDVQRYLGYFTPSYQAIRSDYLPDGTVSHHTVTLESMKKRAQSFVMDANQNVDFNVASINYLEVLGDIGIINFTANFSITDKGEVVFGGVHNVTETVVRTDHGWKVSRSHITEVRNNVQKYSCKYELYTKGSDSAMLQIHYPAGTTFQSEHLEVKIEETGAKAYQIYTSKGDQLSWQSDRLYLPDPNSNMTKTVTATNRIDVYNELVTYYHAKECSDAELTK